MFVDLHNLLQSLVSTRLHREIKVASYSVEFHSFAGEIEMTSPERRRRRISIQPVLFPD